MSWVSDLFLWCISIVLLLLILAGVGCANPWMESYDNKCKKYTKELGYVYVNDTKQMLIGSVKLNHNSTDEFGCVSFVRYVDKIKEEEIGKQIRDSINSTQVSK